MNEFKSIWDTNKRDAIISFSEFLDYYKDVSPTIISDEVFENMLRFTWNL